MLGTNEIPTRIIVGEFVTGKGVEKTCKIKEKWLKILFRLVRYRPTIQDRRSPCRLNWFVEHTKTTHSSMLIDNEGHYRYVPRAYVHPTVWRYCSPWRMAWDQEVHRDPQGPGFLIQRFNHQMAVPWPCCLMYFCLSNQEEVTRSLNLLLSQDPYGCRFSEFLSELVLILGQDTICRVVTLLLRNVVMRDSVRVSFPAIPGAIAG